MASKSIASFTALILLNQSLCVVFAEGIDSVVVVTPQAEIVTNSDLSSGNVASCTAPTGHYRRAPMSTAFTSFWQFADNVATEGFIEKRYTDAEYEYQKNAPRKEVASIALKMRRDHGADVPRVTPDKFTNAYRDIGLPGQSRWVQSVAESTLFYGITAPRTYFEPDRNVTRAEAYAMIMNSVCMTIPDSTKDKYRSWQQGIHSVAQKFGLTSRSWQVFEPERPVLRQEIFILASMAADWAETTGGCDPEPVFCSAPDMPGDTVNADRTPLGEISGVFAHLYDTPTETAYSYTISVGGNAWGVRNQFVRMVDTTIDPKRIIVEDMGNVKFAANYFIPVGQVVLVRILNHL